MPPLKHIIPLATLLLLAAGCEDDNNVNQREGLVPVEVHLLATFSVTAVVIEINGEEQNIEPWPHSGGQSDPLGIISTELPRGMNQVRANYIMDAFHMPPDVMSADFELGDADQYYLAIDITANMNMVVQDSPFMYL